MGCRWIEASQAPDSYTNKTFAKLSFELYNEKKKNLEEKFFEYNIYKKIFYNIFFKYLLFFLILNNIFLNIKKIQKNWF